MNHSENLRLSVCSGVRNVFFTSCCVIVLPPRRYFLLPKTLSMAALPIPIGSMPGMLVEAAVLDRQDRLHHVRREWPRAARRAASRGRSVTSAVMSGASSVQVGGRVLRPGELDRGR